jgi:hypothetical protein
MTTALAGESASTGGGTVDGVTVDAGAIGAVLDAFTAAGCGVAATSAPVAVEF